MKKLCLFFTLLCFAATTATAAPVIVNGVLISWADASGDIVIPDEVTAIANNVFNNNKNITSVSGGANVTSIGAESFAYTNIQTVEFPKVNSIDFAAFNNCSFLTSASFPIATTFSSKVFFNCSKLTSVSFPIATVVNDFEGCVSLTSVSFPKAETITTNAFHSCSSLISVSFPMVTTIGWGAFGSCSALTSVSFPMATTISEYAFINCTSLTSVSFPLATTIGGIFGCTTFSGCSSLTSVSLPMATTIGVLAFQGCSKLTSVSIPKVTIIGGNIFENCIALKDIDLPKITSIGSNAFKNCYLLETVNLPEINEIGSGAFESCVSLKTADCSMSQQLTTVDPTAFPVSNSGLTVLVYSDPKVALFPTVRDYKVIAMNAFTIDLAASPLTGGTVTGGGTFPKNTSVTINALPAANYHFVNWTNASSSVVSTDDSYTFSVTEGLKLTANFELNTYAVTIDQPANGTLQIFNGATEIPAGSTVTHGTSLRVAATPDTGYSLDYITANGEKITTLDQTVIINSATTISATFKKNTYIVTITQPANGTLNIKNGDADIKSGDAVEYETELTVTLAPGYGYLAGEIKANGTTITGDKFTITEATTFEAVLTAAEYSFTIEQPTNGTIQLVYENKLINSGESIPYLGEVFIFAFPVEGYRFSGMTVNAALKTEPLVYSIIEGNTTVSALFEKIPPVDYTLRINTAEHGKVEVYDLSNNLISDGASLTDGSQLKIKAIPDEGYELDFYTIDNKMNVTAIFKIKSITEFSSPEASSLMNIYPNPGANLVNVELSDELRAKQLVVTDMSGKAVMIEPVTQQRMKLDVSKLPAGMYLIKAADVSRQLIVGK